MVLKQDGIKCNQPCLEFCLSCCNVSNCSRFERPIKGSQRLACQRFLSWRCSDVATSPASSTPGSCCHITRARARGSASSSSLETSSATVLGAEHNNVPASAVCGRVFRITFTWKHGRPSVSGAAGRLSLRATAAAFSNSKITGSTSCKARESPLRTKTASDVAAQSRARARFV